MAAEIPDSDPAEQTEGRTQRRLKWRHRLTLLLVALGLMVVSGLTWLDSDSGHRFVVQEIASLEPQSGLRIEIGEIEGSLYRKAILHDVRLSDPKGVFLSAPIIRLDWWPLAWLSNRLAIDDLDVPRARLARMPQFNPSETPSGKILPDFDIRIMRMKVGRLDVDEAILGRADIFTMEGDADIRSGRAVLDLSVRALRGRDRLVLALDSRPNNNRFDIDLTANAPAGGLIGQLAGLSQDANVRLEGDGDWKRWDGQLVATVDGKSAAGFEIGLRKGDFHIDGNIAGSALGTKGLLPRVASPRLRLVADGTFENKLISGHMRASSNAIALDVKGGVHLGGQGYDNLTLDLGVRRPAALMKNLSTNGLIARMRLDGPFDTARFEYLLRAKRLQLGRTILHDVYGAGDGRGGGKNGVTLIPLKLSARQVDGQGELVASILRNVRIEGMLQKRGTVITSSPLQLKSDKIDGELLAMFDMKSGRYDLALLGDIRGLLIPGLGIVDLHSRVNATPDRTGAFSLTGRVQADMRRLDNGFFRTLGGGLPRLQSDIALGADGRLLLSNLSLRSPLMSFNGSGVRNSDGTIKISGSGAHRQYGPLRLTLTGMLDRPAVDLVLARPLDAAGLADVHMLLDPYQEGYHFTADGQSAAGPFTGKGDILMPRGGDTSIDVASLVVNGAEGQGLLRVVDGGLAGRLDFNGSVKGPVELSVVQGIQKLKADMRVARAEFAGAMPLSVNRGNIDVDISFDPDGATIDATLRGSGIQAGKMRFSRFAGNAKLKNGAGTVNAQLVGQRGRAFDLQLAADVTPDDMRFSLGGTLDGHALSLDRRGRLSRIDGGWALDPLRVRYRGGEVRIHSAAYGAETRFDIGLSNMSLSLLDLANVDLGLGGKAEGRIRYTKSRGGVPTGDTTIKVKGLTRSGLTRTSAPIDLGLNAQLTSDRLAMRAVASQKGAIIGRGQALMTPLGTGDVVERLRAAPVRAQIRYVGPADALWRLSTVEIIDLKGQVAATANIRGTGVNPIIEGALKTKDATLESPITGMRISHLASAARFDGSRLVFSELSGVTKGGGTISGRGSFDFSLGEGIGIDMTMQADRAEMLDRDDIGATVTGPIRITSDGVGGTISGEFDVVRSRFTLGRAAEVAQIPELQVIELNSRRSDFAPVERGTDWNLDIKAQARNRLMVRGMGLASEWRMDMQIGGSVANPRLIGRADLVRGSYDFAGRRFDLTQGALRFTGAVPANPTLDITAEASVADLNVTIRITGTSAAPEISFNSVPALPQEEVMSRLLFGSSITQLSAPEALQLASAVGSLQGGGGGLDPINAVRKAAGLDRLRILPADPTTDQKTSIGVGKYITRKTYVELITDGQGYSATRLEYQVTRWLSLLASISTLGRQSTALRVSKDY